MNQQQCYIGNELNEYIFSVNLNVFALWQQTVFEALYTVYGACNVKHTANRQYGKWNGSFLFLWITGMHMKAFSIRWMVRLSGKISHISYRFILFVRKQHELANTTLSLAKTLSQRWMHEDSPLFVFNFIYPNANATVHCTHFGLFVIHLLNTLNTKYRINIIH